MLEFLLKIDRDLLLFLNGLHHPVLDHIMVFATGKLNWIPFYAVLLFLIFKRYKWYGFYLLLAVILVIVLSDQLSASVCKPFFERLRPCKEVELRPLLHMALDHCGGKYGFVSSHAANSFGLASFIALLFRNKYWTIGMYAWAALVAYSRIYLGVHYPGDILGGALLGIGCGYFTMFIVSRLFRRFHLQL